VLFEYPLLQPLGKDVVECAIHHEPGVHEDLHPHMWRELAKTKAHVYVTYVIFGN